MDQGKLRIKLHVDTSEAEAQVAQLRSVFAKAQREITNTSNELIVKASEAQACAEAALSALNDSITLQQMQLDEFTTQMAKVVEGWGL